MPRRATAKFGKQTPTDYAGHLLDFMSVGVVVTKIMTFFHKCVQVRVHFCSDDLRSVGGVVGRQ